METKKLSELLHELTAISQMFHSYELLLQNEGFHLQPKKLKEICHKGALKTREIRQISLEVFDGTDRHVHSVTFDSGVRTQNSNLAWTSNSETKKEGVDAA